MAKTENAVPSSDVVTMLTAIPLNFDPDTFITRFKIEIVITIVIINLN